MNTLNQDTAALLVEPCIVEEGYAVALEGFGGVVSYCFLDGEVEIFSTLQEASAEIDAFYSDVIDAPDMDPDDYHHVVIPASEIDHALVREITA